MTDGKKTFSLHGIKSSAEENSARAGAFLLMGLQKSKARTGTVLGCW